MDLIPSLLMMLIGFIYIRFISKYGRYFLLSDICLIVTAFSLGLGPLFSFLTSNIALPAWEQTIGAYTAFYLYIIGLMLSRRPFKKMHECMPGYDVNKWHSPIFIITKNTWSVPINNISVCFLLIITLKIYAFSKGGGISGLETLDVNLSKNYIITSIELVASPFMYAISFYSLECLWRKSNTKYALVILFGVILFTLLLGRRGILYFGVLVLISYLSFYGRVRARHLLTGVVFIGVVFAVFSPIYLTFRLAVQSQASLYGGNTLDIIGYALSDIADVDHSEMAIENKHNVKDRALGLITWASEIEAAEQLYGPLLGAAFIQGQMAGLPRMIRGETISLNPKIYVQQQFGLNQGDATYSQAAQGIADFGIFGGLLAGFSMGIFVNYGVVLSIKVFPTLPLFGLCILSYMFAIAVDPEVNPGFELIVIRNLVCLGLILWIAKNAGIRMKTIVA